MKKINLCFLRIFDKPLTVYLILKELSTWIGCFGLFTNAMLYQLTKFQSQKQYVV